MLFLVCACSQPSQGEHIRHLLNMGQIEGGEWRDAMFLGNNGVATFRSQRFRRISETCCSTIVIPPMEWDFPVYNIHKIIGQRIRNYTVAVSDSTAPGGWAVLATGSAVGTKRIHLFGRNITAAAAGPGLTLRLAVSHAVAPPVIRQFAAFAPCPTG